jgi:hypothetical protein
MDDPAPELEAEAQMLRQRAWVASEFYKACVHNGLPAHMAEGFVVEWYAAQIENQVMWQDLSGDD